MDTLIKSRVFTVESDLGLHYLPMYQKKDSKLMYYHNGNVVSPINLIQLVNYPSHQMANNDGIVTNTGESRANASFLL